MASAFQPFNGRPAGASGFNSSTRQPQPTKPAPVDLSALQNASRLLLDQLAKDAQIIPDLGETMTGGVGQASGNYSIFPDDIRVPFQKRRFIGIPDGLFQYYDAVQMSSQMGIFPEIERVWISIDNKLFLWDYIDGQEISSFLEQPDTIAHIALVKPKPGLFVDDISHVLVLCTAMSVLLMGVSLVDEEGMSSKQLRLYATDFKVQTDVEMTTVVGTEDGRIFMSGVQDGCLYEFHYQSNESWFAKRVQVVNHSVGSVQSLLPRFTSTTNDDRINCVIADKWRNLVYTLTASNNIGIYKPNGEKTVEHLQTISNIYKSAQDKAPGSPALISEGFTITALHVVAPHESRAGLQLCAVTKNGVRLFFGPSVSYGYSYGSSGGGRPIGLMHVRLPPTTLIHPDEQTNPHRAPAGIYGAPPTPGQPSSRPYIISNLDMSAYSNGLTIATQQGDTDGTDYILCLAPDLTHIGHLGLANMQQPQQQQQYSSVTPSYNNAAPTSNRPPLYEYATLLSIPGKAWAVATLPLDSPPIPPNTPAPSSINELATQFTEPASQFLLMTNVGLTFLMKRRAIDYLKAALEELLQEQAVQPIVEFRDSFGREQTCAMLLGLASGNTFLDGVEASSPGAVSVISPELQMKAKSAFYDFGERPVWTERPTYGTAAESKGTVTYSGRRDGLAIYFSRLIRSIWKANITKINAFGKHELSVSPKTLLHVQQNLFALKDFMDKNPHLFHSATPIEPGTSRTSAADQEAWKAEHASVTELTALLSRTIEALSFMMLLNDYRLGDLVPHCDPESRKLIETQTFEDLITTQNGMTISRALVNVVIDQQIGQQISVDTISEVLQHRCGSFCSTDDVMLYKAKECIRKAAETRNPNERQNSLAEALRLFTKAARILEFEKLREIIGDFQQLSFAKGAVLLPLACAQAQDPDNAGLEFWHLNPPSTILDARKELAENRLKTYDLVLDSLSVFEEKSDANKAAAATGNTYTDDPEAVRSHAYELAFASDDEMFHSTLYDWLIERGLADDLLEMRPQYLEAHLRRDPPTVQKYQLLWQFYVKNGQPLRAAEVLAALAESTDFDLDLNSRVESLTLAVANAKSHPISAGGRHETAIAFLTDLEEKLEVAQVQLEVYQTLAPHISDSPEVGAHIDLLSKRLFTMTEIYQDYAVRFDHPQMKLLCLHVSEHRDENLVRPLWVQIFDEIMKVSPDVNYQRDEIFKEVTRLGQRFYPSESAFPLRTVSHLLVTFMLANKSDVHTGWVSNILIQCNVPYAEAWEVLHNMYESQVPPFNEQANVQALSAEIAVLVTDWLNEVLRPQSSISRAEFPAGRMDIAIDQYLSELEPSRTDTRAAYENIKRQLRRYW
ncbi:nucleoporin Nup157/170 [Ephemerocybe angulata]|uniref:Nucleoporin Nup157/170 n=1 Tax=Ephemerocybe angulata TaxID=980116 RepID=A0A8H6IK85_9AGAR|nr:nucleoporin Nup157/170 [Tulosesus angulatus]